MLAWMNRASLEKTVETGKTHFWSRSRQKFWMKGEESGHTQTVKDIAFDCDGDTLLLQVDQIGAACHEGYQSCFFRSVEKDGQSFKITERNSKPRSRFTAEEIMDAAVTFAGRDYCCCCCCCFCAGMDFLSTWIATPNLVLEGNPSPKNSAGNGVCCQHRPRRRARPVAAVGHRRRHASVLVARAISNPVAHAFARRGNLPPWHVERVQETRITVLPVVSGRQHAVDRRRRRALIYFSNLRLRRSPSAWAWCLRGRRGALHTAGDLADAARGQKTGRAAKSPRTAKVWRLTTGFAPKSRTRQNHLGHALTDTG